MHVKKGCKDLKRYPQISRRVRDTLAHPDRKAKAVSEPQRQWSTQGKMQCLTSPYAMNSSVMILQDRKAKAVS